MKWLVFRRIHVPTRKSWTERRSQPELEFFYPEHYSDNTELFFRRLVDAWDKQMPKEWRYDYIRMEAGTAQPGNTLCH